MLSKIFTGTKSSLTSLSLNTWRHWMDMPTRWWTCPLEDGGEWKIEVRQEWEVGSFVCFHDELRLYMWYQNTEHLIGQPRLLHSGSVCNIHQMKKFQIFCRFFVDSVFSMVSPLVFIFCQPGYKATPIIFMCGRYYVLLLYHFYVFDVYHPMSLSYVYGTNWWLT